MAGWSAIFLAHATEATAATDIAKNYFLPGYLEAPIKAFVDHYNHQRYHESLNNVTLAGAHFGRDKDTLKQREKIKRKTLETRCLHHRQRAA